MNRRVSDWENEEVKGMALSCDSVHHDNMAKVKKLRDRQAAYRASLPTEPEAVRRAVDELLCPGAESYPGGFEEALHLSHALGPMITMLKTDVPGPDRDALLWIADHIMFGLEGASCAINQISDILGNPARIEDESRGT